MCEELLWPQIELATALAGRLVGRVRVTRANPLASKAGVEAAPLLELVARRNEYHEGHRDETTHVRSSFLGWVRATLAPLLGFATRVPLAGFATLRSQRWWARQRAA